MQQVDKFENTKTANNEDWVDVLGSILGDEDGCDLYSVEVLEGLHLTILFGSLGSWRVFWLHRVRVPNEIFPGV